MASVTDLTGLLVAWRKGSQTAQSQLLEAVYQELRQLATLYLRRESPTLSVSPTVLVHEAYLRLVDQRVAWQNRGHFFGVAAQAMRRVLVDHARAAKAAKRGGGKPTAEIGDAGAWSFLPPEELLALDAALSRLATLDARWAHLVELRFFTGLTIVETAELLGLSPATVKRDWSLARAWLYRELRGEPCPAAADEVDDD